MDDPTEERHLFQMLGKPGTYAIVTTLEELLHTVKLRNSHCIGHMHLIIEGSPHYFQVMSSTAMDSPDKQA